MNLLEELERLIARYKAEQGESAETTNTAEPSEISGWFGEFGPWGEREWSRTSDLRREFFRDLSAFKRESDADGSTPFGVPTWWVFNNGEVPPFDLQRRALAMNTGANATLHSGHAYTIKPPEPDEPGIWRHAMMLSDTVAINELVIPDEPTLYKAVRGRIIRARTSHALRNWKDLGREDIEAGS